MSNVNQTTPAIMPGTTSRNKDWFSYCAYWGTENRVLQRMGGNFNQAIEVTITPINPTMEGVWENLARVMIRYHFTHPTARDKFYHVIGNRTVENLVKAVGRQITDVLLHDDLLNEIDQDKLRAVDKAWQSGGGLPFILICKDPSKYLFLVDVWRKELKPDDYRQELFKEVFAMSNKQEAALTLDEQTIDNVPASWLVHYAELMEERGDDSLSDQIRDLIKDETGMSHQDIISKAYHE